MLWQCSEFQGGKGSFPEGSGSVGGPIRRFEAPWTTGLCNWGWISKSHGQYDLMSTSIWRHFAHGIITVLESCVFWEKITMSHVKPGGWERQRLLGLQYCISPWLTWHRRGWNSPELASAISHSSVAQVVQTACSSALVAISRAAKNSVEIY